MHDDTVVAMVIKTVVAFFYESGVGGSHRDGLYLISTCAYAII